MERKVSMATHTARIADWIADFAAWAGR